MIEYLNILYVSLCIIQLVTDKQNKGVWLILIVWLLLPQPEIIKQDVTITIPEGFESDGGTIVTH